MKTLYIIGNGFDLHHNLQTDYNSFGLCLRSDFSEIYEHLLDFFDFADLEGLESSEEHKHLWSQFESDLANLDSDSVMDKFSHLVADPGGADFRDRNWGDYSFEMKSFVDNFCTNLLIAFNEFINSVDYPSLDERVRLKLSKNAFYLSFNYTETLQRYYQIEDSKINYIHGRASDTCKDIVLGHAIEPENFIEPEPIPPAYLTPEQLAMWEESMSDQQDFSTQIAQDELHRYFKNTFKPTTEIIEKNETFFKSISIVKKVYILGHSLSDVDLPYFKKIIDQVDPNARYFVTYFFDSEKSSRLDRLISLGVREQNIKLIKMLSLSVDALI